MNRRQVMMGGGALALAGAGAGYAGLRRMGSIADYDAATAAMRAQLPAAPALVDLVRLATLAPSGHNTQPWRFRIGVGGIGILPDTSRRTPVVDPDDHHLFASLGCAAETLALAAGARGSSGEVAFNPADGGSVAVTLRGGPDADPGLREAITQRRSTRTEYDGRPVSGAELRMLADAAAMPGVDVVLMTGRTEIERVRDLVVAGNSAQMADPPFMQELRSWLRFNPREAMRTGDGLFSASSGSPVLPTWLGPRLFDWTVTAGSENDKYARHLRSSAGVAVFVAQQADPGGWVRAGRSCQRFALQATALGLKHAFINQPVEVASLRPELAALAGTPGRRPDILMRFGHGPALPFSARRPVQAVLDTGTDGPHTVG